MTTTKVINVKLPAAIPTANMLMVVSIAIMALITADAIILSSNIKAISDKLDRVTKVIEGR